jgi:hypothetical protein
MVTKERRLVFVDFTFIRQLIHVMRFKEIQQCVESLAFVVMPSYSLVTDMYMLRVIWCRRLAASLLESGLLW